MKVSGIRRQVSGLIMVLMFLSFIFSLSGCAVMSKKERGSAPGMLEPQAALKFIDVPVPVGFKYVPKDSYEFESSGVRVGVLRYQGKANPDQVVNFYKEQMPMYNWNLLNVVEYGERMLNFDREAETCVVRLSGSGNKVVITISLGPKSQAPKKAKQPIK